MRPLPKRPTESPTEVLLRKYASNPVMLEIDELVRLTQEKLRLFAELKVSYALELEAKENGNSPLSG